MKKWVKFIGVYLVVSILFLSSYDYTVYAVNEPRLIIESYSITNGQPVPGGQATLSIVLRNLSKTTKVSNILLTYLNTSSAAVYPVDGSSNQIYISEIGADSEYKKDIPLGIQSDYDLETAPITISLIYQDSGDNSYNNAADIYLPIIQEDEFVVSGLSFVDSTSVNSNALLSLNYGNNGNEEIYNVKMKIDGDISEDQKVVELGDLTANDYKTLEYYLNFSKEGIHTIDISFTYEDGNGNIYSINKGNFDINVAAEVMAEPTSLEVSGLPYIDLDLSEFEIIMASLLSIAVVLVVAVILKIAGKRRKYI